MEAAINFDNLVSQPDKFFFLLRKLPSCCYPPSSCLSVFEDDGMYSLLIHFIELVPGMVAALTFG